MRNIKFRRTNLVPVPLSLKFSPQGHFLFSTAAPHLSLGVHSTSKEIYLHHFNLKRCVLNLKFKLQKLKIKSSEEYYEYNSLLLTFT